MYRNSGLLNDGNMMSIDGGGEDGEEEEEDDDDMKMSATTAAVSPARTHKSHPVAATPRTSGTSANVALVTPDGQPIHLPTTPVVARKLDVDTSSAMDISSLPSTTTGHEEEEEEGTMKEGDQANALLSRRFQARQHSK